jgi:exonuclease III
MECERSRRPSPCPHCQNWARRHYANLDVMCFQEMQASTLLVQLHLQSLVADCTVITDSSETGRVGSAIVVPPHITVLDSGVKGDGTFSWVKVHSPQGPICIGSVYAPANRTRRVQFWSWLQNFIQEGNWLLAWWNCPRTCKALQPSSMAQRPVVGTPWLMLMIC